MPECEVMVMVTSCLTGADASWKLSSFRVILERQERYYIHPHRGLSRNMLLHVRVTRSPFSFWCGCQQSVDDLFERYDVAWVIELVSRIWSRVLAQAGLLHIACISVECSEAAALHDLRETYYVIL